MKIKSTVWQVLAAGSFGAGLLYALGIEGTAQVGGTISDSQFITAMALILAGLALMRLGFAGNRPPAATVTAGLTAAMPAPRSRSTGRTGGTPDGQQQQDLHPHLCGLRQGDATGVPDKDAVPGVCRPAQTAAARPVAGSAQGGDPVSHAPAFQCCQPSAPGRGPTSCKG